VRQAAIISKEPSKSARYFLELRQYGGKRLLSKMIFYWMKLAKFF